MEYSLFPGGKKIRSKILLSISSLLAEPNADDPLEPAIADLMNNNYDMYLNNVKEYIEKYSEIH